MRNPAPTRERRGVLGFRGAVVTYWREPGAWHASALGSPEEVEVDAELLAAIEADVAAPETRP